MTAGLHHGTQFGVPVREELRLYVWMRGNVGQVKQCVPCHSKNFEMLKKKFQRCHTTCYDEIVTLRVMHFVNSS